MQDLLGIRTQINRVSDVKYKLPKPIRKILRSVYCVFNKKYRNRVSDIAMNFGTANPDLSFYVVRTQAAVGLLGFFAVYFSILNKLLIADQKKLIPVIDMENYKTYISEEQAVNGTKNVWEYYYEQPSEYSLDEVYRSKNVVLSRLNAWDIRYCSDSPLIEMCQDKETISKLHGIVKKYIRFNEGTEAYIEEKAKGILLKDKKILGVASRGTDYTKFRVSGHPIQPSTAELIEITKQKVIEWNVDYVFITTEENETLAEFKEAFADKILYSERERSTNYNSDKSGKYFTDIHFGRENDKFTTALEYLTEIVMLSRCNYLIGTASGGLGAAVMMNGGEYEGKCIIDLGCY